MVEYCLSLKSDVSSKRIDRIKEIRDITGLNLQKSVSIVNEIESNGRASIKIFVPPGSPPPHPADIYVDHFIYHDISLLTADGVIRIPETTDASVDTADYLEIARRGIDGDVESAKRICRMVLEGKLSPPAGA